MAKYFTPEIDRYFAAWIVRGTWHTGHKNDEDLFFGFVWALDHYDYDNRFDESLLREKILLAVTKNHSFNEEAAKDIVDRFVRDARQMLDFVRTIRRLPNTDIEQWEPPLK